MKYYNLPRYIQIYPIIDPETHQILVVSLIFRPYLPGSILIYWRVYPIMKIFTTSFPSSPQRSRALAGEGGAGRAPAWRWRREDPSQSVGGSAHWNGERKFGISMGFRLVIDQCSMFFLRFCWILFDLGWDFMWYSMGLNGYLMGCWWIFMGLNRTIGFNEDFMEMSMGFVKMMAPGGSRQDGAPVRVHVQLLYKWLNSIVYGRYNYSWWEISL